MAPSKQTVLIIGGGWHTPQSYSKLTTALESAGFNVHVPAHPSMNQSRPPNGDLNTDTSHIRSYVENLLKTDREIIVLMHSYGGQVGTNSLHGLGIQERAKNGLPGGVAQLIYMAACAVREGQAMIDMVKHHGHVELMPLAFDFADDMSCVSRDPKTLLVGANTGVPAAEVENFLSTLARWNGQCMYQPLTTTRAAWRDIPVTYIHTTMDMTVPLDYQKWLVDEMKKNGVQVQTATVETGHCPNLTASAAIASIVEKVATGQVLDIETVGHTEATSKESVKDAILNVGSEKS